MSSLEVRREELGVWANAKLGIRNEELEVGWGHLTPPVLWLTSPANFVPTFSLIFVVDGVLDVPRTGVYIIRRLRTITR